MYEDKSAIDDTAGVMSYYYQASSGGPNYGPDLSQSLGTQL